MGLLSDDRKKRTPKQILARLESKLARKKAKLAKAKEKERVKARIAAIRKQL